MRHAIWLTMCAGLLLAQLGCRHPCGRRPLCGDRNPAPPPKFIAAPPMLGQPQGIQQSGGFPVLPPDAKVEQPGVPSISKTPEAAPPPETKRDVKPRVQLYAPEVDEPRPTPEPPAQKPSVQASLPPIPQFASVRDNVYAGLRPPLDGLDWLHDNRVATVVQIRLPDVDGAADKKQIEKRNTRYVSFEVSPQTLTKEKADEFIKLVRAGAKQGVFVYDQDGSLAGAMWYLYFRHGEYLDDDASQLRARQLGLQLNRDGQHRDMWLAVQKVLSENSK
ncbi:MAG: hypothetical protein EXR98_14980 [Gemmataceae bacterium]|nr:hypothetical protein [Gemmataceae bacterium]